MTCKDSLHYPGNTLKPRTRAKRERLRLLTESNKLSQNKLAKKVGIPQSTISELLSGTKQMNVSHMIRLSAVFGVEPAVFMPKRKN